MKNTKLWLFLAIIVLCGTIIVGPGVVWAQDSTGNDNTSGDEQSAADAPQTRIVTFEEMGLDEFPISGSNGSQAISFQMPHGWIPAPGTTLNLNLRYLWVGQEQEPGILQVRLNGHTVGTINLLDLPQSGRVVMEVPVEAWALEPTVTEHSLRLQLLTAEGCDERTQVLVSPDSSISVNYTLDPEQQFSLDAYPVPFYYNTFDLAPILFVLPIQPVAADLQAASAIAAYLGLQGAPAEMMQTITADLFSPEMHGIANLILIGTPDNNPLIAAVEVSDLNSLRQGNGLVSIRPSPWMPQRAALVVTGHDSEGVALAARAVSMATRIPAMTGTQAVVTGLPVYEQEAVRPLSGTFRSFGYEDVTRSVDGRIDLKYDFDLGSFRAEPGSYIEIHFAHSMPLDARQSSLSVLLNDIPMGSVALDDTNSSNGRLRVDVPEQANWWRGNNVVRVRASLYPYYEGGCPAFLDVNNQPWITVFGTSVIYAEGVPGSARRFDLSTFPRPFEEGNNLDNLVFVMPTTPELGALDGLVKLSARLGFEVAAERFNQTVVMGTPETLATNAVVIAIGRPTANPYIQSLNDLLAQPYENDQLLQSSNPLMFDIQTGQQYGVVELISWESGARVPTLVVTGTTDNNVREAASFLTNTEIAGEFFGNLMYVYGTKIRAYETRTPEGDVNFRPEVRTFDQPQNGNGVQESPRQQQAVPLEVDPNAVAQNGKPTWAIPMVLGVSGGLLLLLVAAGLYRNHVSNRAAKRLKTK